MTCGTMNLCASVVYYIQVSLSVVTIYGKNVYHLTFPSLWKVAIILTLHYSEI